MYPIDDAVFTDHLRTEESKGQYARSRQDNQPISRSVCIPGEEQLVEDDHPFRADVLVSYYRLRWIASRGVRGNDQALGSPLGSH